MPRKKEKVEIGKFKHDAIQRKRPDMGSYARWKDSFLTLPEVKDYDAYLWGSWPEKEDTWDIDILMSKGPDAMLNLQEMEELALLNFEKSLVDNGILIDMGFTDKPVKNFGKKMDEYLRTGRPHLNTGYVYANDWIIDGVKRKDRSAWKGPSVEQLENNMVKISSHHPYDKQLKDMELFDKAYRHKPIKIKSRGKSY